MLHRASRHLFFTTEHPRFSLESLSRSVYLISIIAVVFTVLRRDLHATVLGKRYNVLRKRVDSWAYDVDQLLLGTILFTLVAFISPTTLTYYTLFALVRFMSSPHSL